MTTGAGRRAALSAGPHALLRDVRRRLLGLRHARLPARAAHGPAVAAPHARRAVRRPDHARRLPDGVRDRSASMRCISGFHTTPAVIEHDGNQRGVQLHVTPAGARALFGFPASELVADRRAARRGVGCARRRARRAPRRGRLVGRALRRARPRAGCGPRPGGAEVPSAVRPETAEAMAPARHGERRHRHRLARRPTSAGAAATSASSSAPSTASTPEGDGAGAALRALEAAVRPPGATRRWPRSPPSAATPTRPTWHASGGRSPGPARRSGWPTSSCPSPTPPTCSAA